MGIAPDLLKILACPTCKGGVDILGNKLVCRDCKKEYLIKKNIPILLDPSVSKNGE